MIPNKQELEDIRSGRTPHVSVHHDPENKAKETIAGATLRAVEAFDAVLKDLDATPTEKMKAAQAIIALGHGKDGLRVRDDSLDAAKRIAIAIATSKSPLTVGTIRERFDETHRDKLQNNEDAKRWLDMFTRAVMDPSEYFSVDHKTEHHDQGS